MMIRVFMPLQYRTGWVSPASLPHEGSLTNVYSRFFPGAGAGFVMSFGILALGRSSDFFGF